MKIQLSVEAIFSSTKEKKRVFKSFDIKEYSDFANYLWQCCIHHMENFDSINALDNSLKETYIKYQDLIMEIVNIHKVNVMEQLQKEKDSQQD